jgi:aspartyl/glutamyl-tRNA(Asn/Gln) amidotransferase C subunit
MKKINIRHIAALANIPLKPEEEELLAQQLDTTLEHIEKLNTIDTSSVMTTHTVTNTHNRFRTDDTVDTSSMLSQKEATMNTSQIHRGMFVVPMILDGE